tara:strand:- start:1056 stop:1829 length:774 start_codon:yes stop_codon:yes gene_type:complete
MKFIDTHSHLYSEQFDKDRSKVVLDAVAAGVASILMPNISSKYTSKMLALCKEFPKTCYPMIGLHPCDVTEENYANEIAHVEKEIKKKKYIAVGEIGLDLHWDKSTLEIQKKAFIYQIKIAKKHNLPIVIHIRDSFKQAIEIVEELNDKSLRGVFHCFTGDINDAKRIINLKGFYLGIGGIITFKNSGLSESIKAIDLKNIILETDSPYLAPSPFRGKRNESKLLINIAEKLAEIYGLNIEDIAKITTRNAEHLFQL